MFERLGIWGIEARGWIGASILHVLAILILLSVDISPLAPAPVEIVSIELVEVPRAATPEEPAVEPLPEPVILPAAPVEPTPEPALKPVAPKETITPSAPEEEDAPAIIAVTPPEALLPQAAPTETLEDAEKDEETIPPQYIIRRDPFLEVAPFGAARVSASVMCSRTNRETRPAFCPEIDDEDVRFALLARAQGDYGGYSPRDEALFAQSTLNRYAGASRYRNFRERQQSLDEFASTGANPIRKLGIEVERHAEGLQNCTPVTTGALRVGGETSGLNHAVGNGSEVFCD